MPERELSRARSRAWLALPLAPFVVVTLFVAGPLAALVAALVAVQAVALPKRARALAAVVANGVDSVSGLGPRIGVAPRRGLGVVRRFGATIRRFLGLLLLRVLPVAVGCVTLLVALDWGVGHLWAQRAGAPSGAVEALNLANAELPPATDDRVGTAAMARSPWAERYFAELSALPFTYAPYLGPREVPVHGRYINSAQGIRASYEPSGAGGPDALDVWFFGGSTLWGEGQRDGHTIPSEVARLAEAEGISLRVWNFGERGYTAFQEYLVFEQELARRDPPDLAVFYHGINETYSLLEAASNLGAQPSIFQIDVTADAFHRAPPLPGQQPPGEPSVRESYLRTSAITRLLQAGGDLLAPPAGAEEPPYQPSPAALERASVESERIYRRSMGLIRHEGRGHGVPVAVFWQPAGTEESSSSYYGQSARMAGVGGGIDISDALADPPGPIYIDGVHTNELGARLSAEAIWAHVGPVVTEPSDP